MVLRVSIQAHVLISDAQYIPFSGPFHPTSALVPAFPSLSYQIFLGETPDLAAAELNADIRRTLRGTLRSISSPTADGFLRDKASFLNAWKAIDEACGPIFPALRATTLIRSDMSDCTYSILHSGGRGLLGRAV